MRNGIIQDLYDSEINFSIHTFWDAGFTVKIGDTINGFTDEMDCDNFIQCVDWLRQTVVKKYPKSEFAKLYRNVKLEIL